MKVDEPLEYLTRDKLQLQIMQNIETEITHMGKTSKLRYWWDRSPNWAKVQTFLNGRSSKSGSTSSALQCRFIGADPDGKTFFIRDKGDNR